MSAMTLRIIRGRTQRRDDFRAAQNEAHAAASLEDVDGGQLLAFDELEESAAAGGNVGNAVLDAVFLDGGERIAAARQRESLAARDRVGERAGALAELVELEHPDRPVPQRPCRPRR